MSKETGEDATSRRPKRNEPSIQSVIIGSDASAEGWRDISGAGLRPAPFAWYRKLSDLRYDYPLVLTTKGVDGQVVRSLSDVFNGIFLDAVPANLNGERLRLHGLKLESAIRRQVARGRNGRLTALWDEAAKKLVSKARGEQKEAIKDSLEVLRQALRVDGEVIDCGPDTPRRIFLHAWAVAQEAKTGEIRDEIARLIRDLSNVLKADFMHSDEGRSPEALMNGVGSSYRNAFDFDAMSRMLGKAHTEELLSARRRKRIRSALDVLKSQRFFALDPEPGETKDAREPLGFVFDGCTEAIDAFRERLPAMIELVKAMSVADLEIANRYDEARHSPFFRRFDETSLTTADLAMFPNYLVILTGLPADSKEPMLMKAFEILSSDLPMKIVVQWDDILDDVSAPLGKSASRVKSRHFARMAVSLGGALVVQAPASHLYQIRERIASGLAGSGPALFSVFTGCVATVPGIPPYLVAAAAMESRAFPVFTFDPSAGAEWEARFSVAGNPQVEAAWPIHETTFEDGDLQRNPTPTAFTFVDFLACDKRFAKRFAKIPHLERERPLVPVADRLKPSNGNGPTGAPYILMVDDEDRLYRVAVEEPLVDAARACGVAWRAVQELGGINNSHARRLVEREREAWEQEVDGRQEQPKPTPVPAATAPVAEPQAEEPSETVAEEAPAVNPDEAYIETPRCTSCNECTKVSDKIFAYNENKQAYIADANAGTYRQLVEAAERCQVSIIHPGKPLNPDEPGLEDLLERAAPFIG